MIRFTDEELKHQRLFRRIELLAAEQMPDGYRFLPQPNDVADFVLGKSTWAVLALTCHIEIFTQVHYRQSIEPDQQLSPLYKDVFFFHWKEESQHAIIDELEWQRENERLSACERDAAVDDLIALVAGIDATLQQQATADAKYFGAHLRARTRGCRNHRTSMPRCWPPTAGNTSFRASRSRASATCWPECSTKRQATARLRRARADHS